VMGSLPKVPLPGAPPEFKVYWQAPPLLIEWACSRLRDRAQPACAEHV
jgi:hypothetical protein